VAAHATSTRVIATGQVTARRRARNARTRVQGASISSHAIRSAQNSTSDRDAIVDAVVLWPKPAGLPALEHSIKAHFDDIFHQVFINPTSATALEKFKQDILRLAEAEDAARKAMESIEQTGEPK